jgi:protein-tyrosine phosphatase
MINRVNRPIRLDSAYNTRELGGYRTADGRFTRKGVYLRGDSTHSLTPGDLDRLIKAGVALVIDMRSPDEVSTHPSKFNSVGSVRYENIAMFDGLTTFFNTGRLPGSMAELYCWLLDNCKEQYRRIFRLFLNSGGASLFHCTAGKDRTGVVAMLLLQLAGVPEDMIVKDYSASEHYLSAILGKQKRILEKSGLEVPDYVLGSKPEEMQATLSYLKEKYQNANNYLLECGISQEEINGLIAGFVE